MATRYQRNTFYQAPGVDTSQSESASNLRDTLLNFSQQAGNLGAKLSAERGAREGARDAGTKAPKRRSNFTASGQAYNRAVIEGHAAAVDADSRETIQRIADDSGTDLAAFDASVQGYVKGLESSIDPALTPDVVRTTLARAAPIRRGIVETRRQLSLRTAQVQTAKNAQELRAEALNAARNDEADDQAVLAFSQFQTTITNNIRSLENPEGLFDPEEAQKWLEGTRQDFGQELLLGQLER